MLNRRYLRVKVLQALYAYSQVKDGDLNTIEKNMLQSIKRVYDLYLYRLSLLLEVLHASELNIERNKNKKLPTEEDLNPNTRFVENPVLLMLKENAEFQNLLEKRKIDWKNYFDDIKKLWRKIRDSEMFDHYMNGPEPDFEKSKKFIVRLFSEFIAEEEVFHSHLHEQSIYWYTDLEVADMNVEKTIHSLKADTKPFQEILFTLFKDEKDDMKFIRELLRKTILNQDDYKAVIAEKTKNWELERIAMIDILLMKMALCELEHFSTIPIKVTLNEYIELAKNFSTPKSKNFINGILDRVVKEWKETQRIQKSGRGLIN